MSTDITREPCPKIEDLLARIPELRYRTRMLIRNDADADDVVQDTLEKALRAWARLRPDSNLIAWLATTMTNTVIDGWRRDGFRREVRNQIPAPESSSGEDPSPWWLDLGRADVQRAATRLPPRFRLVFELFALRGMSYEQIAQRLDLPAGTIATRLRRARLQLRELMTEDAAANGASIPFLGSATRRPAAPAAEHQPPLRRRRRAA